MPATAEDLQDQRAAEEIAIGQVQPPIREHARMLLGDPGGQCLLADLAGVEGRTQLGAGGAHGHHDCPQLRVRGAVISGARGAEGFPVGRGVRHPGLEPVHRAQQQPTQPHPGNVRRAAQAGVLGAGPGGHLPVQPQKQRHTQVHPPAAQHLPARHRPRLGPRQQRQLPGHRGHHLPVARLRHQRHRQHTPHRHRRRQPPQPLPAQAQLPDQILDHPRGQMLLQQPQPHVLGQMTTGLHPPVRAYHRRGDRHRNREHRRLTGSQPPASRAHHRAADPAGSGRPGRYKPSAATASTPAGRPMPSAPALPTAR
jgi:hypothetical protein